MKKLLICLILVIGLVIASIGCGTITPRPTAVVTDPTLCSNIRNPKKRITMDQKDIDCRFTYHPPKEGQIPNYAKIRNLGRDLTIFINENCPESREKSLAITRLEECIMWANAAIARHD